KGEFGEARKQYESAIRHAPGDLESYGLLASLLRRKLDPREAGEVGRIANPSHERQTTLAKVGACLPCGCPNNLLWGALFSPTVHPADLVMESMIANNGQSFQAYLMRLRYRKLFRLGGEVEDLTRARALAPDEAEVQLAAADWAEEKGD